MICKFRSKGRVSSDHAGMTMISSEVSIFCLGTAEYILQLVARDNSVSSTIAVAAPSTKAVKFKLSIVVHTGGLAKNQFWLAATRKKRELENNQTIFQTCVLNPFQGQKIKENFFLDGKSRGSLLARTALNTSAVSS